MLLKRETEAQWVSRLVANETHPAGFGQYRHEGSPLALPGLAPRWFQAPRQVLARLHVLAARGAAGADDATLGRPVGEPAVLARLDTLCVVVTTPGTQALLKAAVVHGELLALRPFAGPSGLIA